MDTDYENLIHLIDRLNDLPDDHVSKALDSSQRQELRKKLRKLNLILENSGEIVDRILHSVRVPHITISPPLFDFSLIAFSR